MFAGDLAAGFQEVFAAEQPVVRVDVTTHPGAAVVVAVVFVRVRRKEHDPPDADARGEGVALRAQPKPAD